MKKYSFFVAFILLSLIVEAQTAHALLRDGDAYYEEGMYVEAEEVYRKSKIASPSLNSDYNLGNSLFNQERFEESIEAYQLAVQRADDNLLNSDIYYNMGNAYMGAQDLEQAIDAYKKAILENPNNLDAKYNLVIAKEIDKMQKQEQHEKDCQNPQPSDEQGEKSEEQKEKDGEQSEQQQPQDQEEKEEEEKEGEEEEDQEEKQDSSAMEEGEGTPFDSTRLEKQTLDSLDAVKLLEIINSEEQKVQEKLRKFNSNRKKQDKDW